MTDEFEEKIRELTRPFNGQLPRPWMTGMKNPLEMEAALGAIGRRLHVRTVSPAPAVEVFGEDLDRLN